MNEGEAYATRWIEAWNSMALERALGLWAEEMTFCSPLAAEIAGSAVLEGKAAVADYWARALAAAGRLHFELVEALWDPQARAVTIVYRRTRGGETRLAAEIIHLTEAGLGVRGLALHGAVV
jgi:hypothetical protein